MRKTALLLLCIFLLIPSSASAANIVKPANNLGLIGYWPFNENSGTQAGDASGKGNSGVINGNVTWTGGARGSALYFGGGTGDYVTVPGFNRTLTGGGSIAVWIYATSTLQDCDGVVFSRGSVSNTGINAGACGNSNFMGFHWNENGPGGGGFYAPGGAPRIPLNEWVLLVLVGEPTQVTSYVYSTSGQYSYVEGGTFGSPLIDALRIGQDDGSRAFSGKIDEVRIYNRVLTATDVQSLYKSAAVITGSVRSLASATGLSQGLAGHWTLDGADVKDAVYDRSGNANNGYFNGSPTSTKKVSGKLGQAMSFDGSTNYIDVGTSSSLNISGAITISAWAKFRSLTCSSGCVLVSNYSSGGTIAQYELTMSNGAIGYSTASGASTGGNTSGAPITETNRWYHVAVTRNATADRAADTVRIYVDGVLQPSSISTAAPPTTGFGRTAIGRDGDVIDPSLYFPGELDDVRIYNRDLSGTEIRQLAQMGSAKANASSVTRASQQGLNAGLVRHWPFDGNDFTDKIYDRSGVGGHGYTVDGPTTTMKAIGTTGQAIRFDGVNDFANMGGPSVTNPLSISMWVRPLSFSNAGSGGFPIWVSAYTSGMVDDLIIGGQNGGNLFVGNSIFFPGAPSSLVPTNAWTHLVYTLSGDTATVFVNGTSVSSATIPSGLTYSNFRFGRSSTSWGSSAYFFHGSIDEARVYNRVLTGAEIRKLYDLGR